MKGERLLRIFMCLVLCVGFTMAAGCASIVSKSQYPVSINSNPSGATVTIKNKKGIDVQKAITPATVILPASAGFFSPENYRFQFEMDEHLPASTSLSAGMDGWYIGNILFGGLIGWFIVDPATGAMWKLEDTVYGNLAPDPNVKTVEDPLFSPPASTPAVQAQQESAQSVADQLRQLKNLKESNLITEEEYEANRKVLVQRLVVITQN